MAEIIMTGKSVEEATEKGLASLQKTAAECTITVMEEAKKGLFGLFKGEAKVKIVVNAVAGSQTVETSKAPVAAKQDNKQAKLDAAVSYLQSILAGMNIDQVEIEVKQKEEGAVLVLKGEKLGILIGRHGETLDALQYLTSLVCNRVEGNYYRITLDCGDYREKREEALKELAVKISAKVKRTGRSQMLEPMNPYERRIIHAEVSDIEGVVSKSKGEEPNRRIIIISTDKRNDRPQRAASGDRNRSRGNDRRGGDQRRKPAPYKSEPTMEQLLKADRGEKREEEKSTRLYSKIEL